jgi:hypothetical protein
MVAMLLYYCVLSLEGGAAPDPVEPGRAQTLFDVACTPNYKHPDVDVLPSSEGDDGSDEEMAALAESLEFFSPAQRLLAHM